jgi:2-polyprenyl-3-methyl-5-hydroxy-6-metoxy-1,4-benzoquinol methylase
MNDAANEAIITRIAARYRSRPHRSYARGKLRWDPVFATAASLFAQSERPLLDIGCGLGLLGQYLHERGRRAAYRGFDLDVRKIEAARAAAGDGLDLQFATGSARAMPAFRGNVALVDLLHYLPADEQRCALHDAAERVASDGVLMIRSVLCDRSWRFRTTHLEERLARMIGWMRYPTGYFPRREDIETPLRAMGFTVRVSPLWGRTPFNSYLFVARRDSER